MFKLPLSDSLGIEIEKNHLALVYLKKYLSKASVEKSLYLPLSPEDKDRPSLVNETIKRFLKTMGTHPETAILSIPRCEILLKYVALPLAASENLMEVLGYQMETYFPFKPEDLYFDSHTFHQDKKHIHLLVIAVLRQTVNKYLDLFKEVGLPLSSMQISPFSLLNALEQTDNSWLKETLLVIRVNHHTMEINLIYQANLCYSHQITLNGKDPLREIEEEIQRIKVPLPSLLDISSARIVLINESGMKDPGTALQEKMGNHLVVFSSPELPSQNREALTCAWGAALEPYRKSTYSFNLLPPELRKKRRKIRPIIIWSLLTLIFIATLSLLVSIPLQEHLTLSYLDRESTKLKPQVNKVQATQEQMKQLEEEIDFWKKIEGDNPSKVAILKELTQVIPKDAWLHYFQCRKRKLVLKGMADSAADLIPRLESSSIFSQPQFTSSITRDKKTSKERFSIQLEVNLD